MLLTYKECSAEDFDAAMSEKDTDVKNISDSHLYILFTKFKADALNCFKTGTNYANRFAASENKANLYKTELLNRGIIVS